MGEATLRIIGVASEDDGVYTCVATNELGSVTSSASLRVLGESTHKEQTQTAFVTFLVPGMNPHLSYSAVSSDGVRVSWKDNFESNYTEVVELGR